MDLFKKAIKSFYRWTFIYPPLRGGKKNKRIDKKRARRKLQREINE